MVFLQKRFKAEKVVMMLSVVLSAQTKFIVTQKCVNGISPLQGDSGSHLVGTFYWSVLDCFVKSPHTWEAVPSNSDGFDKCLAEGGIAACPENNAEGSLQKGNRFITLSLQVVQLPCKTIRLY